MNDELIYCPNCRTIKHFERVEKYVRIRELSRNDKVKIFVIQCEHCEYPIGAYEEPIGPDE